MFARCNRAPRLAKGRDPPSDQRPLADGGCHELYLSFKIGLVIYKADVSRCVKDEPLDSKGTGDRLNNGGREQLASHKIQERFETPHRHPILAGSSGREKGHQVVARLCFGIVHCNLYRRASPNLKDVVVGSSLSRCRNPAHCGFFANTDHLSAEPPVAVETYATDEDRASRATGRALSQHHVGASVSRSSLGALRSRPIRESCRMDSAQRLLLAQSTTLRMFY
jgi:hypothetical protein